MGKYMRKAKLSGEVAVMEVSHQSSLGVRTRARTLALQHLQADHADDSDSSYLQLRSRRLEKPAVAAPAAKPKVGLNPNPNPKVGGGAESTNSGSWKSASIRSCSKKEEVEVSFGENVLDLESRDRDVRETTPCSLIRDSEPKATPGSTTRRTNSASNNRRTRSSANRNIPTTREMEEFFAGAEELQHRLFTERYNFDPVNDCPLPGRYEWVKLN